MGRTGPEREGKHYLVSLDLKKKTLKAARA